MLQPFSPRFYCELKNYLESQLWHRTIINPEREGTVGPAESLHFKDLSKEETDLLQLETARSFCLSKFFGGNLIKEEIRTLGN